MPDLPPFLSSWFFDPPVAYPALGALVVGLGLGWWAWKARRHPRMVWLWTLAGLCGVAGLTGLILSGLTIAPREVIAYVAPLAGLAAAVVAWPVAAILFSESRRPGFDVTRAVGQRAQVYQGIPESGSGVGRVRVHAGGRSVLLSAVSAGPEFPRYAFVRVDSAAPDGRVQVQADDDAA